MKIKGLLLGMLVCAGLVACTNDDIVENNGNQQPIEKANANLTLSISASTNSARDAKDDEVGDGEHGGTVNEGTIKDAAIIIAPNENQSEGVVEYVQNVSLSNDGSYEPQYQLKETGEYKVLVVLNPCAAIVDKLKTTPTPAEAYSYIINYQTSTAASNADAVKVVTGDNGDHFMMANRDEIIVDVKSTSSTTPTVQAIDVERVVSKITFRPNKDGNKYGVETKVTTYYPKTTDGWFHNPDGTYTYITLLNQATANGKTIWVYKNGATIETYEATTEKHTDVVSGTSKTAYLYTLITPTVTDFTYVEDGSPATATEDWSVQLDKYALVNLSNTVYAVRHKVANGSDWGKATPFGVLTSTDYLVDPNSAAKNVVTLTDGLWTDNGASAYFYNTANDLQTSTDIYKDTYFSDLPKAGDETILDTDNALLSYCLENSVVDAQQEKGLVTAIIFRGLILDAEGNSVGTIYKYNGQYYRSLDALKATIPSYDATKLITYTGGYCYYYAPIEHYKDGLMRNAIMRNNIYSLAIDEFTGIGSSTIIPKDGDKEDGASVFLKLKGILLPWKVRFNNVKF